MTLSKTYFQGLVGKGRNIATRAIGKTPKGQTPLKSLKRDCISLLSARGQASGIKTALNVHKTYNQCSQAERLEFFEFLLTEFGRPKDKLVEVSKKYSETPSHDNLKNLMQVMEPKRQDLFKRMNMAPGGTMALVNMRTDLLKFLKVSPELKPVDMDFLYLFKTWFNRGFLTMEPISWNSPAVVLERLIAYEAVHEITSWDDLKRRLDPPDRLCYAFFHPNLADTPLIFVEVALCKDIPGSIQDILAPERPILDLDKAKVATFYSINNCLFGLKGIYFGNFLIKQVVANLQQTHPELKKFVTLSPIPGFKDWLVENDRAARFGVSQSDLTFLKRTDWYENVDQHKHVKKSLRSAAIAYLTARQPNSHRLQNSVARFHLGNGARIENIHVLADTSDRGRANSFGVMVNYLYVLKQIETNHEAFAVRHEIALSAPMHALKSKIDKSSDGI
ncbi:malonyl-CoA decarboxylase domain-containing protein [Hellea balneolensis]|uniref:malonyl-CoA decarboxylase domain-containing protein n=1 Tax=Hellea balneolensis TaxID=287478 RepID=UPI000414B485|nr:malonyl-CoA decarboxylase family protein [Hellea balneolensis]